MRREIIFKRPTLMSSDSLLSTHLPLVDLWFPEKYSDKHHWFVPPIQIFSARVPRVKYTETKYPYFLCVSNVRRNLQSEGFLQEMPFSEIGSCLISSMKISILASLSQLSTFLVNSFSTTFFSIRHAVLTQP